MSPLIFVTPKRHILSWFCVFWVITRQNRSKGLTCGLFPEKIGIRTYVCKNNLTLYFTHLSRSPPSKDLHQNWHSGSSRGRNQLWQFFWQSVKGFGFCRGPKFAISHWLSRSPLTQCWRYRAARDSAFHPDPFRFGWDMTEKPLHEPPEWMQYRLFEPINIKSKCTKN